MSHVGILVGFHVGDRYFAKYSANDPNPQVAAFKLEGRLIDALRLSGVQIERISSIAVTTYPGNPRRFFPGELFIDDSGSQVKINPLVNLPGIKLLSRFWGTLTSLVTRKRSTRSDFVCVYAAHSPNLLAAYLYRKLYGIPYIVYVADLPLFMDMGIQRSKLRSILKKIDASIINALLSKAAGLIVVTEPMILDSKKLRNKPYLVLEGIAERSQSLYADSNVKQTANRIVFYAGGLNLAYGVRALVEAFEMAHLDKVELWLCGRGDLESYLKEKAASNKNIKYLGFLPPSNVQQIQEKSSVLILTRNPAEVYTRYSFPSKILEYLSSGIPVMTTLLSGIPSEYFKYMTVIEKPTAEGIATTLENFFSSDYRVFMDQAAHGKIWVDQEKSSDMAGIKIMEFIKGVI